MVKLCGVDGGIGIYVVFEDGSLVCGVLGGIDWMVWLFGELLVLIDDSGNFVVLCILLGVVYYLVSVIDCVVLF